MGAGEVIDLASARRVDDGEVRRASTRLLCRQILLLEKQLLETGKPLDTGDAMFVAAAYRAARENAPEETARAFGHLSDEQLEQMIEREAIRALKLPAPTHGNGRRNGTNGNGKHAG
jgi:hypothetical protein